MAHAIVAGFDADGGLAGDASVGIGDILSPVIGPHFSATVDGDRVTPAYSSRGRLTRRVFQDGVEVDLAERARVETDDGEVRRAFAEFSERWYGDRFLVWGVQVVKDDEGKRRVFALAALDAGG